MSDTQLWKGAIVPAVSVAVLSVAGATLLVGKSGFVGASLAAFMGAFLLLVTKFTDRSSVDRGSFAICAILITMAWLYGEIRSFLKLRFQMPLPKKEEDK